MSTNLPIEVSGHAFQALAMPRGMPVKRRPSWPPPLSSAYGIQPTKTDPKAARVEFEQCFGSIDLGTPTGVANADIDRDLACVYESMLDPNNAARYFWSACPVGSACEPLHAKARQTYAAAASHFTHANVLAELVALGNARGVPARPLLEFLDETPSQSLYRNRLAGRNIQESLTTDQHFEVEGFQRLLAAT